ncbi:MAG: ATPase domain-containing protein [Thermoplasmata archaeon]
MSKKTKNDRIRTYVKGLDDNLQGGIPRSSIVLIAGSPGTMKSSLGFYILYNNAIKNDRKGVYISLEESRDTLLKGMKSLGMDLENASEKMSILDIGFIRNQIKEFNRDGWMDVFKMYVRNLKRNMDNDFLVIDSLAVLETMSDMENPRKELFDFFSWLHSLDVTTFLIHEMPYNELYFSDAGEGFLTDGIVHLELRREVNNVNLYMSVMKMRKTDHSRDYFPLLYADGFELIRG